MRPSTGNWLSAGPGPTDRLRHGILRAPRERCLVPEPDPSSPDDRIRPNHRPAAIRASSNDPGALMSMGNAAAASVSVWVIWPDGTAERSMGLEPGRLPTSRRDERVQAAGIRRDCQSLTNRIGQSKS